jgi:hypothetical protein
MAAADDSPLSTTTVKPDRGTVTWDSEGTEGGKYHSRKLHVPSDSSGLTIGRGYDMKEKNAGTIVNDLTKAGVNKEDAEKISGAHGKQGDDARQFIKDNSLESFEVTLAAQKVLFETTYDSEASEAKRLATKDDVTTKYGTTDWDNLDPAIKDILVDMKFRGDYDGVAREKIQKFVVTNDLDGFAKSLCDRDNWKNVPQDRFKRRKEFLERAVEDKKKDAKKAPPSNAQPPTPGAPPPAYSPRLRLP